MDEIYKNFGNPECHKCDNGPPFNGREFHDWSIKRGIRIKASYPYHPPGIEPECFMKPLKKTIQIGLEKRHPIQKIINELLRDYRSTPYPVTGLTLGDMLLRGGYRTKFPHQPNVSVGTVHTIIPEELKMWKICAKFVPRVLREDQKERRYHDSREMVELINSDPAVLDALVTCDESWIYCYDPETKRQSSEWKHAGSPRPKKARQSKSTHKLLMIPFFLTALASSTCTGFPLDSQQGILC